MERRKTQAMASHSAIFLLLSIFTFVFLGSEYLYVNMVSRIVEKARRSLHKIMRWASMPLDFLYTR